MSGRKTNMDAYKLESFALVSGDDGSFLGAGTEDNEEGEEQTNLDFGGRARYAVQRGTKRNKYRNRTMVDAAPLPSTADDNNAIPTALLSAAVLCSYICLCCIYMFLLLLCCACVGCSV